MTAGTDGAGRVALVTGAGSGIGRATALLFAARGARVAVADIDTAGGEETVAMIGAAGGEARFIRTDVSQAKEVEALVSETVDTFGRLDWAHNNAGIDGPFLPTGMYQEEDWDQVMAVNLKGAWLCMKYELPVMASQGAGAIVNTSSATGLVGVPFQSAYVAAKTGIVGLTRAAALEYAEHGVRINTVCPGVVNTPVVRKIFTQMPEMEPDVVAMHPIGRLATPDEVAEAVLWLCSDASSFVTGTALSVDGGWTAR